MSTSRARAGEGCGTNYDGCPLSPVLKPGSQIGIPLARLSGARRHGPYPNSAVMLPLCTICVWWINAVPSSCKHILLLLCILKARSYTSPLLHHCIMCTGGGRRWKRRRRGQRSTSDLWPCCSPQPVTGKQLEWLIELWVTDAGVSWSWLGKAEYLD